MGHCDDDAGCHLAPSEVSNCNYLEMGPLSNRLICAGIELLTLGARRSRSTPLYFRQVSVSGLYMVFSKSGVEVGRKYK